MSSNNEVRTNIALVLASILFCLILAEVTLRAIFPAPIKWTFPQEGYEFDAEVGHCLEKNQIAFTHDKPVITNSEGIRDREFSSVPRTDVFRVLAVGDSQTFGNGLEMSDTWPKQLEKALNGSAYNKIFEVVNSGLPGSDTWQHEIILGRMLEKYHPHAVVLAFYVNDVVVKPERVQFFQRRDRDNNWVRLIYMLKRSVLLLTLRNVYDSVINTWMPDSALVTQNALLDGKHSPEIDARWEQVSKSMAGIMRETRLHAAQLLIVSLPRRDQVDGRTSASGYNQRLESILKQHGISYINMLGPLQDAYIEQGKRLFIPWDGHNSAIANRIIADEINFTLDRMFHDGL